MFLEYVCTVNIKYSDCWFMPINDTSDPRLNKKKENEYVLFVEGKRKGETVVKRRGFKGRKISLKNKFLQK